MAISVASLIVALQTIQTDGYGAADVQYLDASGQFHEIVAVNINQVNQQISPSAAPAVVTAVLQESLTGGITG